MHGAGGKVILVVLWEQFNCFHERVKVPEFGYMHKKHDFWSIDDSKSRVVVQTLIFFQFGMSGNMEICYFVAKKITMRELIVYQTANSFEVSFFEK